MAVCSSGFAITGSLDYGHLQFRNHNYWKGNSKYTMGYMYHTSTVLNLLKTFMELKKPVIINMNEVQQRDDCTQLEGWVRKLIAINLHHIWESASRRAHYSPKEITRGDFFKWETAGCLFCSRGEHHSLISRFRIAFYKNIKFNQTNEGVEREYRKGREKEKNSRKPFCCSYEKNFTSHRKIHNRSLKSKEMQNVFSYNHVGKGLQPITVTEIAAPLIALIYTHKITSTAQCSQ